ncbi:MAG: hypothetical protein HYR83_13750 [Planctomycetes bacterium]|nr:hypothetical protein [Planctomycetota bacterium]
MTPTTGKVKLRTFFACGMVVVSILRLGIARGDNTHWVDLGPAYCDSSDPPRASFFDCIHWSYHPPCCCDTCNTLGNPVCEPSCAEGCTDEVELGSGFKADPTGDPAPHELYFGSFCHTQGGLCPANNIQIAAGDAVAQYLKIEEGDFIFDFGPGGYGCNPSTNENGTLKLTIGMTIGAIVSATGVPGDASLLVRNGVLTVDQCCVAIGDPMGSTGKLTLTGANTKLDMSALPGEVWAGNGGGYGELEVLDGATIYAADVSNGPYGGPNGEPSAGSILVSGGGSVIHAGCSVNNGSLTIQDGGRVSELGPVSGVPGYAFLGISDGVTGSALVTGQGSSLTDIDRLTIGGVYHTDTTGHGILSIQNGGMVSSIWGVIGNRSMSRGEVTVAGLGSRWIMSGPLLAGDDGHGTLQIDQGAVVACDVAEIGNTSNGDGTVTVNSAGSSLTVASALRVGEQGKGALNVTNGARVDGSNSIIGDLSGSIGKANVAGRGSRLYATDLQVGGDGTGSLSVSQGAVVSVGSTLNVTPNGTVSVTSGGTITVGKCPAHAPKGSNAILLCSGGTVIADGVINARIVDLTHHRIRQ